MNEMKQLETLLRTWAPRRPSARVEQRLFAAPQPVAATPGGTRNTEYAIRNTHDASPPFRLSWLAPATAALLLTCVLFNPRNGATLAGSANSAPLVAMIMSNQSAAAYLPGSFKREQNTLGHTLE